MDWEQHVHRMSKAPIELIMKFQFIIKSNTQIEIIFRSTNDVRCHQNLKWTKNLLQTRKDLNRDVM